MKAHLANALTVLRLALVPAVVACQQVGSRRALIACFALMVLTELTDWFDGVAARRVSGVSDFGKLADPMADSLYRMSLFIAFAVSGWIPLWMALVFVWRDVLVSYLRSYAASSGLVVSARRSGKIKAIVQAVVQLAAVLVAVIVAPTPPIAADFLGLNAGTVIVVLVFLAAAWTVYSAVDYTLGTVAAVRARSESA